jgi:hypothetical protein
MTSQKDLSVTDAMKRGIYITYHRRYKGRATKRMMLSEPPMNVRDSELFGDSNEATLPKGVPVREPTREIQMSDIISVEGDTTGERAPILPAAPESVPAAPAREDSSMFDLQHLLAIAQGKAEPAKPSSKPPVAGPSRESSVMVSLKELSLLEDQRVEGEHADGCSGQLKTFEMRLAELKRDFEKTKAAYVDWGIEMDPALEENIAALDTRFIELEARLASLMAEIQLRPGQEGYKDRQTLIQEFDRLSSEISGVIWSVGAGELQNRTLLVTLEMEKKKAEQIDLEETVGGEKPKITRLTKHYQEEGEAHILGAGYRLELAKIGKSSCTFILESKTAGYEKSFSVGTGKEWSENVPGGMKVVLEWDGPSEAGRYKVKIAVVTRSVPSEESLERGVDELLADLPAEPGVEVDLESLEVPAPAQKPKGAVAKVVSGFLGLFKSRRGQPEAEGKMDEDAGSGTTQELSLSDVEAEEPDGTAAVKPDGIPWIDEHSEIELNDNEVKICEEVLEERKRYWILPAPQTGEGDLQIKSEDGAKVRLRGKIYFILNDGEGFANTKRIARVGKTLHIWPEAKTDYDFLGSKGIFPRKEVEWPESFSYYQMTLEESAANNYFFPENRSRFLHPVPDKDTKNETDRLILETLQGTQQITVGGRKYYVLNINSVSEWRETLLFMPKARIVTRGGNWLSVWDQKENGYYMFFNSTSTEMGYFGTKLPSIKEKKGVKLYDSEKADIAQVFEALDNVWLYELDNIRDMNAGELSWIIKSANSLIQNKGSSPLVSAGGRWYAVLDIFIPDSTKVTFNGEFVVAVTQSTDPRERIAEMRRKLAAKKGSSIPAGPSLPDDVIAAMPEGEVRFLYYIGPENQGVALQRASVDMTIEGEKSKYIIIDRYMEGTIPAVRKGMGLFMAKGNFGNGPAEEDEDSVELEIDR